MIVQLNWIKNTFNEWLDPRNTNWDSISGYGVYVVWSPGTLLGGPTYLKVGQGDIKDRMQAHMRDFRITRYPQLRFTFAFVHPSRVDGVEKYLGGVLRPLVAERFPDTFPVAVNLPRIA